MGTRTKRIFGNQDKAEFLKQLNNCRDACVKTCTNAPIKGDEYRAADKLIGQIDTVIEVMTGNRKLVIPKS